MGSPEAPAWATPRSSTTAARSGRGVTALAEPRIEIDLSARDRRRYERLRARCVEWARATDRSGSQIGDLAFLIPDLVVLLLRLARDSRVPMSAKAIALGGVGYVLSPIDLIPEFVPGIGLIDDVLVMAAALSRLVNDVHPDVVREHWAGQGDALVAIQGVTDWAEDLVTRRLPGFFRRLISR